MRYLSLLVRAFMPNPGVAGLPVCRYYPTCSQYSSLAYREYNPIRATWLTVWRLLRCNPWSPGGVDYPGKLRPGRDDGKAAAGLAGTPSRLRRLLGPRS